MRAAHAHPVFARASLLLVTSCLPEWVWLLGAVALLVSGHWCRTVDSGDLEETLLSSGGGKAHDAIQRQQSVLAPVLAPKATTIDFEFQDLGACCRACVRGCTRGNVSVYLVCPGVVWTQ